MPTRYLGGEVWIPGPGRSAFEVGIPIGPELASRWFQALYETPLMFSGILDSVGRVVDANRASIESCGLVRADVLGQPFWECGWWNPDPDLAQQIRSWCERALATGNSMRATSRYFMGDGSLRMVDLALHPVSGPGAGGGHERFLVATGLDITDALMSRAEREELMVTEAEALRLEAEQRSLELAISRHSEEMVRERLALLAGAAVDMVTAETASELTSIVFSRAFPVLEAEGGALIVRQADQLKVFFSDKLDEDTRVKYGTTANDSPFPGRHVARTGERLILPNRAAGIAFLPAMAQVYQDTQRYAWVYVPLRLGQHLLGSLAVSWADERDISEDEVQLIEAFAALCAQALERIQATEATRESTRQVQHMAESLQRSLLSQSPTPEGLSIASRYLPAAQAVQVGGDWHDAFTSESGSTVLVVGDVAGHDGDAAAAMAQLRNLLRGLAIHHDRGPASLLASLDRALDGLQLDAIATCLVAQIDTLPTDGGSRPLLRWSSAGHPPPLLWTPGEGVAVLEGGRSLLLGVDPQVERSEMGLPLPRLATVLLYTDGLIERRGESLETGLQRLVDAFTKVKGEQPEEICEEIVDAMLPENPSDDVVLLVVKLQT
jgi:PAS domain S-box-containing protein